MNVPADALTSGRPNTEPSRTFSADSRCSHLSAAPDHSATDIAIPPLERSPNQTAYRSATVVLERNPEAESLPRGFGEKARDGNAPEPLRAENFADCRRGVRRVGALLRLLAREDMRPLRFANPGMAGGRA